MAKERIKVDTTRYSGRLAVHIRALREAKGMTVDQAAKKAKVPVSTWYSFENGSRRIPADFYPKLAKALGVTSAEFLPAF